MYFHYFQYYHWWRFLSLCWSLPFPTYPVPLRLHALYKTKTGAFSDVSVDEILLWHGQNIQRLTYKGKSFKIFFLCDRRLKVLNQFSLGIWVFHVVWVYTSYSGVGLCFIILTCCDFCCSWYFLRYFFLRKWVTLLISLSFIVVPSVFRHYIEVLYFSFNDSWMLTRGSFIVGTFLLSF